MFAYIDGDNIGLKIEKSFMDNDEKRLKEVNNCVKCCVDIITEKLIEEEYEIIFSGADGIICKKIDIDVVSIKNIIENLEIEFSAGVGTSLREAFLALRYAKANGKNIISSYSETRGFKLFKLSRS